MSHLSHSPYTTIVSTGDAHEVQNPGDITRLNVLQLNDDVQESVSAQHLHQRPNRTDVDSITLISQLHSLPIPHHLLVKEVDQILEDIEQVEETCIQKVKEQMKRIARHSEAGQPYTLALDRQSWQSLHGNHRTLLDKMYDFFVVSQDPRLANSIKSKARESRMVARMWKFGIHDFLELLRSVGDTKDLMSFMVLAYQMMSLLYETVPHFREDWMECLGDLARYGMGYAEQEEKFMWRGWARYWYLKVLDSSPNLGRLHHHIAILNQGRVEKLSSFKQSLLAIDPFPLTRQTIMQLYQPSLAEELLSKDVDRQFIRLHALMFQQEVCEGDFLGTLAVFLDTLKSKRGIQCKLWKDLGASMAVCNIAALLWYEDATLIQKIEACHRVGDEQTRPRKAAIGSRTNHTCARRLVFGMLDIALQQFDDKTVLPYIHLVLVFLWRIVAPATGDIFFADSVRNDFLADFPFASLCNYLNHQLSLSLAYLGYRSPAAKHGQQEAAPRSCMPSSDSDIMHSTFPSRRTSDGALTVLKEDYLLREQIWSIGYLPPDWYSCNIGQVNDSNTKGGEQVKPRDQNDLTFFDDMDHFCETSHSYFSRRERILHLSRRIATYQLIDIKKFHGRLSCRQWMSYDYSKGRFKLDEVALPI